MVDARQEAIDELESFEKDYVESFDDENFDNEGVAAADLDASSKPPEPEIEEVQEEGEPEVKEVRATDEQPETPAQDEEKAEKPKMVTLPEGEDAEKVFGELAGKRISHQELVQAGLVDKLLTWGWQGRHLIGKGQEELEEARKMRELIEEQVNLQKQQIEAANTPPPLNPKEHAEQVVQEHLPHLKSLAEAGGIEHGFIENYPMVASQLEARFQAASALGTVLVQKMDELVKGHDTWSKRDANEAGESRLRTLSNTVSESEEMFAFLGKDEGYRDFIKWATAEESTLRWVDRDVEHVTEQDIMASALLYMRENPDKFTKKKKKTSKEERQLASGGGAGKNADQMKATKTSDEISDFMNEYGNSFAGQDY